jgi:hypothetical protein
MRLGYADEIIDFRLARMFFSLQNVWNIPSRHHCLAATVEYSGTYGDSGACAILYGSHIP